MVKLIFWVMVRVSVRGKGWGSVRVSTRARVRDKTPMFAVAPLKLNR